MSVAGVVRVHPPVVAARLTAHDVSITIDLATLL
jgi:hypothetical protein